MMCLRWRARAAVAVCALVGFPVAAQVPFGTSQSGHYLLVGMGPVNKHAGQPGVGQAINVNNFELGANKAPVPSTSGFLTGGSSGGPGLLGNVPNIPLHARPVFSGIGGLGNIAVTSPMGVFNLQDVGVYGTLGVRAAAPAEFADAGTQNSFFNDPNHFPNTFTPTGFTHPGVHNNTGGFGAFVSNKQAVQSTRIDAPNAAGVTGGFDFARLRSELSSARGSIDGLAATGALNVSSSGGTIRADTTITLSSGLNVIDIVTGGGDFKLDNANLVIDGPADAVAIFRVPDHANMLISNGNVLLGNAGVGMGSVLFYTDRPDNATHFSFDNAILNGVAFWSLGGQGGVISINDAQGCTQLIADKITLNDVRFNGCSFIPAPGAMAVLALAAPLALRRRRAG